MVSLGLFALSAPSNCFHEPSTSEKMQMPRSGSAVPSFQALAMSTMLVETQRSSRER